MRLHKPVHPSQQPHLQGFFQGGIPDDGGVAAPNSIATSSGSYDQGGLIQNPLSHILNLGMQNIDKIGQQPQTEQQPGIAPYPTREQAGPQRGSDASDGSMQVADSGSSGGSYDSGGVVDNSLNPLNRILNLTKPAIEGIGKPKQPDDQPPKDQNAPKKSSDADDGSTQVASADSNAGSYDDGGVVDPNSFLQWPNQQGQAFDDGGAVNYQDQGQVDPGAFLDPTGLTDPATAELVKHTRGVYDGLHSKLENAWHAEQQGNSDNSDNQGYARGGGIPMPPGPAGPGVRPQPATGNAGRPNFTAPDPARVSAEKNYAQNVSSRPATSPARGTSFSQPGPDGGQRGQEWYGKSNSPYGAGRKTKNG